MLDQVVIICVLHVSVGPNPNTFMYLQVEEKESD